MTAIGSAPTSTAADPLTAKGLTAGFTDLMEEADADLEVEGTIPEWVVGGFVRNGTARWMMGGTRLNHWFDGTAMLHRFGIEAGRVHYRNRWLRSANYEAVVETGRNEYAQFGTDPKRSFWGKVIASLDFSLQIGNNDFITVTELGSEWISVGETPTQISIDIESLDTKGIFRFKDRMISMWTCSHMLHDRARGRVYNYSIFAFPGFSRYRVWHIDENDHTRTQLATVKDPRPSWMHSFGMSERHIVLAQFPLKLDAFQLFTSGFTGRPIERCMHWHEGMPTRTAVLDKETGAVVATVELPAMFAFHILNTWDEDDHVVLDVVAYDDAAAVGHMYFDSLLGPEGGDVPPSRIVRYRIPLDGSAPAPGQRISDAVIEMPRIHGARSSLPYRYAYGQSWSRPGRFYDRLVKIDTHGADPSSNATAWGRDGWLPSEPVFVPRPGGTAEDDGVVLAVVLDVAGEEPSSFLVVLDAATFTEVARATVPHVVPFGLHGEFVGPASR
ncbi:carotenoid oxygenase family protein [Aquihabitans sp. McL0605]|uniref:carotenoid oxygenase family protein n=1 Tax=Aquihabitans sp. McL0605 TaxID=3415671 RepID=UPI003CF94D07